MGKDRLKDLIGDQDEGETADEAEVVINFEDRDDPMEKFFGEVREIRGMIDEIESNVEEVKKKHIAIKATAFSDALDKLRNELEDLMANIKKKANEVKNRLMKIEKSIEETADNYDNADLRIRKTQNAAMSRKFVEVMNEYNRTQVEYREKYKDKIKHQLHITGVEHTDDELEEMIEQGNLSVFTEGILLDTEHAKQTLAEIEARHADIIKLENSIRGLRDMFLDMALLISNQGDMIDRVLYNVENTKDYVEQGKTEIVTARVYMAKARKKKIMIIACLVIFFILLILWIIF
jgi:syntaxin 1A